MLTLIQWGNHIILWNTFIKSFITLTNMHWVLIKYRLCAKLSGYNGEKMNMSFTLKNLQNSGKNKKKQNFKLLIILSIYYILGAV